MKPFGVCSLCELEFDTEKEWQDHIEFHKQKDPNFNEDEDVQKAILYH
jgi:hypothetical protein